MTHGAAKTTVRFKECSPREIHACGQLRRTVVLWHDKSPNLPDTWHSFLNKLGLPCRLQLHAFAPLTIYDTRISFMFHDFFDLIN